jgi:hypothetical protein
VERFGVNINQTTTIETYLRYTFEIVAPSVHQDYFLLQVKSLKSPLRKSKNNFMFAAKTREEIVAKIEEVKARVTMA